MRPAKLGAPNIDEKQLRCAIRNALRAKLRQWDAETDIEAALGFQVDDLEARIADCCTALENGVSKLAVDQLVNELIQAASEQLL